MIDWCCDKLKRVVESEDIQVWGRREGDTPVFAIYGRSQIADDGDGYEDDMTNNYTIRFCPFCGAKIEEDETP